MLPHAPSQHIFTEGGAGHELVTGLPDWASLKDILQPLNLVL